MTKQWKEKPISAVWSLVHMRALHVMGLSLLKVFLDLEVKPTATASSGERGRH